MPFGIADDDGAKLPLIPQAKERRIQWNGSRQLGNVVAIDGTVAGELGQRQIMRVESDEAQALKRPREELGQPLGVRLREARDARVLKVKAVFLGKR